MSRPPRYDNTTAADPVLFCDYCARSKNASHLVLYDRWAMCAACADSAEMFDRAQQTRHVDDMDWALTRRQTRKELVARDGEFSPAAVIVRRVLGVG